MASRSERSKIELSNDDWWHVFDRAKGKALARLPESLRQRVDKIMMVPHGAEGAEVYVFLMEDSDLANSELVQQIRGAVHEELDREGVGPQARAGLRFVLDSRENVAREYEGNYHNRMR